MWEIGDIKIKNRVVLAPMAGTSNPAYMKIVEEMDCGLAFTELLSSEAIIRNNKKTLDMLKGIDDLNMPIGVQIFGANPQNMAKAAKILIETYNVKIIDINLGCPVPKVAIAAGAGSGLLKYPDKIKEIVTKVVNSVDVPVTVKIRSGWDSSSINAPIVAKICEEAGAKAITVHGRTKTQGYSGKADWNIIKKAKETVNIPVIGNGDIKTPEDAKKMLEYTKCDAIMIGRAALGNPWIIENTVSYLESGIIKIDPTKEDKKNMIKKHLEYLLKNKTMTTALLEMRTNSAYYLKGIPGMAKVKQEIFKTKTKEEFIEVIDRI
ncbi:MAG: tRNA dihydrouridine synthase DusB [Bacilli bacterium]|nr:tRNA dihydrouridine synthase DusB [Bacilli bacterium]